ncbi:hypothetical protein B7P43_G14826, partial [Cryptotermes secundus]
KHVHESVLRYILLLVTLHSAVQEMIESLGYRKVCAHWVPRLLTEDHKELLQRYRHEGDEFLLCNVTGDESWFHHFEPETKRQSMEWHHLNSPSKRRQRQCHQLRS